MDKNKGKRKAKKRADDVKFYDPPVIKDKSENCTDDGITGQEIKEMIAKYLPH